RWVRVIIVPVGSYAFIDEIMVFEGPPNNLTAQLPGTPVSNPVEAALGEKTTSHVRNELRRDIEAVRQKLQEAKVSDAQRQALSAKLDALAQQVGQVEAVSGADFKAILPFMPLQERIYAVQAELWRAEGKPRLRAWHCHRWQYIPPNAEPPPAAREPQLSLAMMNGEVRAEVVNVTSAAPQALKLKVRIDGLPGGANPPYVEVAEVLHVATRFFRPVPAALPVAQREGADWVVTVPAGMVRQVWLQFRPTDVPPGIHRGRIVFETADGERLEVPLELRISRLRFPATRTLLLGGWSYTDGPGAYGVTPQNRDAVIAYLREHGVNAPWAGPASMPVGEYDEAGNLTEEPDTSRFDEWVAKWPGAKQYNVFLSRGHAGESFAGAQLGTDKFNGALGNWAKFWAQHMTELGLKPSQLCLLIFDEPRTKEQYEVIAQWARAIKAGAPEIQLFEDPIPAKPDDLDILCAAIDILCPNRPLWIDNAWYADYFGGWRQRGKRLWLYSCSGPTRSFDPYLYYLLQEWHAFAIGAEGVAFWSFTDTGKSLQWNDFVSSGDGAYCPMYLGPDSVVNAKWMEAIREGCEDYEYLTMASRRVAQLGNSPAARHARQILEQCVQEVLATAKGTQFRWNQDDVDYTAADRARIRLLRLIETM
ncbi:MAG: hypothetical protein H5T86_12460, partial [Armatimonadetes bacterium]|nr:hypothetical protein [Armatimonadota bacterium]